MAKTITRMGTKTTQIPAKLVAKSVFEVDSSRLGIGVFNRPLLDREMRRFRAAWEESLPVGLEASEVDPQRISFDSVLRGECSRHVIPPFPAADRQSTCW